MKKWNFGVFIILFALISVGVVSAGTEIIYDDDSGESGWWFSPPQKIGVMFTKNDLPYTNNFLTTVRINFNSWSWDPIPDHVKLYFFDSSFNEITWIDLPFPSHGWNDIDVSSLNLIMNDDFLIAIEQYERAEGDTSPMVYLEYDLDGPDNHDHSYTYDTIRNWFSPSNPANTGEIGNWMIRAVVEQKEVAVPEFPSIAFPLITIIGLLLTVVAVRKMR